MSIARISRGFYKYETFMRLSYDFYKRNVVEVARDLIGKNLVFGNFQGIITETEAYRGSDDEASHAYKGMSNRSAIMFGPPGHLYDIRDVLLH